MRLVRAHFTRPLLAASIALAAGCSSVRNLLPMDIAAGRVMLHPVPADFIDAIDRPLVASSSQALLEDEAQVIGVVGIAGTPRAYPTKQLDSRELVNDVLDGEPIAVVW